MYHNGPTPLCFTLSSGDYKARSYSNKVCYWCMLQVMSLVNSNYVTSFLVGIHFPSSRILRFDCDALNITKCCMYSRLFGII